MQLLRSVPIISPQRLTVSRRTLLTIAAWIALCSIWGSTFAAIKIGLTFLPPFTFASARFIVAFLALASIAWFQRSRLPTRTELQVIIKTGLLQFTVNYGLVFWGERYISSGLTAILQATIPLFGFLIAHYKLHNERLSIKRIAGLLLGLAGVVAIFSDQIQLGGSDMLIGSFAILLGAFCAAYSSVLVKANAQSIDSPVLISGQIAVGVIPLIGYSFIAEGGFFSVHWTWNAVTAVGYLAIIGTVVAFTIFYWLIKHTPVTSSQLTSLVIPVAAVLVGVIFLGETVSQKVIVGGVSILVGLSIILWPSASNRGVVDSNLQPASIQEA